jgi:NADH-quinone oxidoreductase subunit F
MAADWASLNAAEQPAAQVIDDLLRCGLRDRDYENRLTGERLRALAAVSAADKLIVCDCADVEPGLQIARFLLGNHALEIVDGALIAAYAGGSRRVRLHVGSDDKDGAEAIAQALEQARSGEGPLAAPALADITVEVVLAPFRQNMKGYEEQPTLVLTAETLLQIARAIAFGPEWLRQTGAAASPGAGTKFVQLTGAVAKPGIYEVPLGVTLHHLVDETGGGVADGQTLKAVIVGGAKGACYRPDELDTPLDFDTLRAAGGVFGSGEVAVLSDRHCIVDQVRRRLANTCYDTCGKCSLGREGSYQLREIVTDATRGKSRPADMDMLRELGRAMRAGCACAAGAQTPNPVLSTLTKFPEEYEAHMRRKKCDALACDKYVTFHILPDLCDGCGECVDACPEDAIVGGRKKIHIIDQDSCEKCGKCLEVCNDLQKAIVKAGSIKPKTPKRPIPVGTWNG